MNYNEGTENLQDFKNTNPDLLETYGEDLADPQQRRQMERQSTQQFYQQVQSMGREIKQNPELRAALQEAGTEKTYIMNNRANSVQINDGTDIITIPGQLTYDLKGPFRVLSRNVVDGNVQLGLMLESPINRNGFDERNQTVLEELTYDEYRKKLAEFLEKRKERLKDNNVEQWSAGRHEDGSVDEWDQSYEVNKINYHVIRSVG